MQKYLDSNRCTKSQNKTNILISCLKENCNAIGSLISIRTLSARFFWFLQDGRRCWKQQEKNGTIR